MISSKFGSVGLAFIYGDSKNYTFRLSVEIKVITWA